MSLFAPKYEPSIIDLQRYEADLLYQKANRMTLMPPPCIPGLAARGWSAAELEAMRENRTRAEAIYERAQRTRIILGR